MATYLITQANGHQARWTIEYLLAAGAKVHALVRDPKKVHPDLQRPGITIFGQENNSPEALFKAAQGCKGLYLNTWPANPDVNSEGEQATAALEAAKKAGVESAVASTSFYTGDRSKWDTPSAQPLVGRYYTSKMNVETAIRNAGLKYYTILRPAFIHHDYLLDHAGLNFPDFPKTGTLAHAYKEGARMLHIDEKDIGNYAAAALLDPVKFNGAEIELGNEYLTVEECRDIIAKVTGKEVKLHRWNEEEVAERRSWLFVLGFELWANIVKMESSSKLNVEKWGIPFTSFEEYCVREKKELLRCFEAAGL